MEKCNKKDILCDVHNLTNHCEGCPFKVEALIATTNAENAKLKAQVEGLQETINTRDLQLLSLDEQKQELEAQVAEFVDAHKQLHKHYRRVVNRFSALDFYDNHGDEIQGMIQVQEHFEIDKVVKRAQAKAKEVSDENPDSN